MKRFTIVAKNLNQPKINSIQRAAKKIAGVGDIWSKNDVRRAGEYRVTVDAKSRTIAQQVVTLIKEHNGDGYAEIS